MPRRPPKKWFHACELNVGKDPSITDPSAVCGSLWFNKMSPAARQKALARESTEKVSFDINDAETVKAISECVADLKPPVDMAGATKKVVQYMVAAFEAMRDEANDKLISPEKFWTFLTKELKTECKIQDEHLLLAGFPTQMVMDTLNLEEAEAAAPAASKGKTLTYKNLHLTMGDDSTKKVPVDQALAKIAPFTKNFKSPMEALVMGDPDAILKVFQHVYGKDVKRWYVPAEESVTYHDKFSALAALALSEMYRVGKFNMPSCVFEMSKEGELVVNESGVVQLVDGFDKTNRAWLQSMFPHVVTEYLHNIINETKSVLNELPKEVVDKLFVNINPEYLKNLKESELRALATKFAEAVQPKPDEVTKPGGKAKQGTVGKQSLPVGPTVKGGIANKKYANKMAEGVVEEDFELPDAETARQNRQAFELGSEKNFTNEEGYNIYFATHSIEISKDGRIVTSFHPDEVVQE